ncbi:MAG: hypothetical protein INR70_17465 [Parafilimonas terrae]|nr:hypothetical protein [Parafilimonas terrae]
MARLFPYAVGKAVPVSAFRQAPVAKGSAPLLDDATDVQRGRRRYLALGEQNRRDIAACFDRDLASRRLGRLPAGTDPLEAYFAAPAGMRPSPNLLFDEVWYEEANRDVREAIASGELHSGFVHFVAYGLREGRAPNPALALSLGEAPPGLPLAAKAFDAEGYMAAFPVVRRFVDSFPIIDAFAFYQIFGRRMGHTPLDVHRNAGDLFEAILLNEFDHTYYTATYLNTDASPYEALKHYRDVGARSGHNPNADFDEMWYRTFYSDVNTAFKSGDIISGYYHYVMSGKSEHRRPKHELSYALEVRMGGVTQPQLIQRADDIERRMETVPCRIVQGEPRTWFCLPTLNPDISFGGYKAVFELIKATARTGRQIGIFITDDPVVGTEYFAHRERDRELVSVVEQAAYVNRKDTPSIGITRDDIFVVYSVWDGYVVQPLLRKTRAKRFLLLAQEYEPIFYECGSTRVLTDEAYRFDHVPLYNSRFLSKYFRAHEIGPFAHSGPEHARAAPREGRDFFVFEHVPTRLALQPARDRQTRTLALYARPEMHAARNLFELAYLALRRLCAEGLFDDRWRFVGLGSLRPDHVLPLSPEHELEMVQKMPLDAYERFMSSIDVGVSLMLAPHPSVVPFEFAATGAVVVTNTYENRSERDLRGVCPNIVPCRPTLEGVEAALRTAVARAEDFETRARQRLVLPDSSWARTFDGPFLDAVYGSLTADQPVQVAAE